MNICAVTGCDVTITVPSFLCKRHWFSVSKAKRDEVWELFRTAKGSLRQRRAVLEAIQEAERKARVA